jgi:Cysteine rich repeat
MRKLKAFFAVLPLICLSAVGQESARAQDYLVVLKSDCAAEVAKHCSDISRGEGRLAACLYSHEDQLSSRCGEVLTRSIERLAISLRALANVTRDCRPDAQRLCNGVIAGQGNLVGCLSNMKMSLSPQCSSALNAASLSGMGDR